MQAVRSLVMTVLLLASVPSCHQLASPHEDWVRTDLYFGLTRRDSSAIADGDFQQFVDTTITPSFPSGLTITSASGQYLDSKNLLHREPSRVLTLLYPKKDAAEVARKIERITTIYCRDFDQECVLQTRTRAAASFLSAPVPAR